MLACLVLSSSPGYEVKMMKLLGDANWWMPKWTGTVLRIPHREPTAEVVVESA